VESSPPRILVSLATYNEHDNLAPLVHEVHSVLPDADILVIDDNSPDGTGRVADELAAVDPRIHVLHRPGKLGLGTATLAAVRFADESKYDLLINMDADFSHSPRYLPALLAGMNRHDVMIGSRYVPGGGALNWPLTRRVISRCVNTVVRLTLRIPAQDSSGAFRCYRVAKLREADLECFLSRGYSFQQELLYRCRKARCRIAETPIIFENRRAGASKVNSHEAARSIGVILLLGLSALFGRDQTGSSRPRAR
jgi:dolichol-phosphate mannosyltransferase